MIQDMIQEGSPTQEGSLHMSIEVLIEWLAILVVALHLAEGLILASSVLM
jgi:hypothetical protein